MNFFAIFIEIDDLKSANRTLLKFKEEMKVHGGFVVFELEQSNYDFLYNSLIEKANKEIKRK
jgi:hypothetical protein